VSVACVTGASGMIGRRIVEQLIARGAQVRVLSRSEWRGPQPVDVFQGSLLDDDTLGRFVSGAHSVFHCAAELRDAAAMWRTNVDGTQRLLRSAGQSGVHFFCHLSSVGVIGRTTARIVDESTPCNPQNEYERSKLAAEKVVLAPGRVGTVVVLRPTNVVAPERPGAQAIAMRGSARDRMKTFVQGRECAHIVHAGNVAAAAMHAMDARLDHGETFIVSSDDDPRNTFAGLWGMVRPPAPYALPVRVPHALRRFFRGRGKRGDTRYSSAKLLATGFVCPYGFEETVTDILSAGAASR
jgi:nucleoside-diphosphate-sugar epimerase